MKRSTISAFVAFLAFASSGPASAQTATAPLSPGHQCRAAIHAAERAGAIPPMLMAAIARVESGRADGQGNVTPWPWTINAEGAGQYFPTREAAIAAVRALQAQGMRSIDVGCMQVNLHHHPDAFATLEQAFDPAANAAYAARFLNELYATTRDWTRATAFYHSQTPERGELYQRRVAAAMPAEQRRGAGFGLHQSHALSVNAFSRNAWNSVGPRPTGRLARSGLPVARPGTALAARPAPARPAARVPVAALQSASAPSRY
jgi:hypothetical protein